MKNNKEYITVVLRIIASIVWRLMLLFLLYEVILLRNDIKNTSNEIKNIKALVAVEPDNSGILEAIGKIKRGCSQFIIDEFLIELEPQDKGDENGNRNK